MKKGLLLAGAVFSLGVLASSANAVTIRIDEEQVLKFGARGIIDAVIKDKRNSDDKTDLIFGHRNARIYFKYRFNKILSVGFQTEFIPARGSNIEILDSFINLAFAPEFNVIAGSYKVPFERHSGLQSGWSVLFPTGPAYGDINGIRHVFTNPVADRPFRSGARSAGLTFWGNIADGMFKYYLGIFDVVDEDDTTPNQPKTAISVRVQFTPTMLGYKPEKGYVLKNTYVGKKDVLTIGLSYTAQPYRNKEAGYDDQSSWGVDLMWEQKFGTIVPDIQIGYVQHENWGGNKEDDRKGWLVQGQLLYDQKVFLGKPALVVRYMQGDYDDTYARNEGYKEDKPRVWGVGVNYFIKGPANRISLAVDNIKDTNDEDYTDVTLSIFYNF